MREKSFKNNVKDEEPASAGFSPSVCCDGVEIPLPIHIDDSRIKAATIDLSTIGALCVDFLPNFEQTLRSWLLQAQEEGRYSENLSDSKVQYLSKLISELSVDNG